MTRVTGHGPERDGDPASPGSGDGSADRRARPDGGAELRRASLRASTLDGTLHAAMVGFGETYFAAFALLLGATPFQTGLLATLPILCGSAFQLLAPYGASQFGHKRWVVGSAIGQALTFLPIFWMGFENRAGYGRLMLWVCVYWTFALGINPAWNSWMGRMIPSLIRSRYFGRRNVAVHSTLFLSVTTAGFVIHALEERGYGAMTGFLAIFAVAALSRLGSAFFLSRQHDPGGEDLEPDVPLREVLAAFPHRPYGQLILLLVLLNAAVNVSAAYFTPFMLRGLELSYAQFTILIGTAVVSRVLASPYWGEIAIAYGNRRALQVAATLVVPLAGLWVVSDNFLYLVGLQLLAGFAWSGLELSTFLNFFDCTDERNRARVLSVYNLLNGFAIVGGSLAGGFLLRSGPGDRYAWIFLLSTGLRAVALLALGKGVGRRRVSGEHSFHDVFLRVLTLRPGQGPDDRPMILR